jgi:hypothetical protein
MKDKQETEVIEYNSLQSLQKVVGGLTTITDDKLAVISANMVEMDRANHTAGRSQTQTTNQLMSLTMLSVSPYRMMRQCLSQIERKRTALEGVYFKLQKKKLKIAKWREKGDELSLIKADEAEHKVYRQKDYIDGALKEIGVFQQSYDEIRKAHNIPENWDERDAEEAEIDHHIKQAFRQAHRNMVDSNVIGAGNAEYLEQYGIHVQTAKTIIAGYIMRENQRIANGEIITVNDLYVFLDRMAVTFHDHHKLVLEYMGIKDLIKEDYLYLEKPSDDNT